MKQVTVAEAKNRLSELLARAERGEEIAVTRYGKPVARIVSMGRGSGQASKRKRVDNALRRLVQLRRGIRLGGNLKAAARQGLD